MGRPLQRLMGCGLAPSARVATPYWGELALGRRFSADQSLLMVPPYDGSDLVGLRPTNWGAPRAGPTRKARASPGSIAAWSAKPSSPAGCSAEPICPRRGVLDGIIANWPAVYNGLAPLFGDRLSRWTPSGSVARSPSQTRCGSVGAFGRRRASHQALLGDGEAPAKPAVSWRFSGSRKRQPNVPGLLLASQSASPTSFRGYHHCFAVAIGAFGLAIPRWQAKKVPHAEPKKSQQRLGLRLAPLATAKPPTVQSAATWPAKLASRAWSSPPARNSSLRELPP